MCLTLRDRYRKQVAKKDITVYKHLYTYNNIFIKTTYRNVTIEIGEVYTSDIKLHINYYGEFQIGEALHSFKYKKDAVYDVTFGMNPNKSIITIVKCIIPKGSTYYIGKFTGCYCYASDKLKYVKIIKQL